jgi:hypothetical protein
MDTVVIYIVYSSVYQNDAGNGILYGHPNKNSGVSIKDDSVVLGSKPFDEIFIERGDRVNEYGHI